MNLTTGDDTTYGNPTAIAINTTGYPNELFDNERYSDNAVPDHLHYEFPVCPGEYTVNLLFAERFFTAVGSRIFDVMIEGNLVLEDLDQVALYGPDTAGVASFDITVLDDTLNLEFIKNIQNSTIRGIEIIMNAEMEIPSPAVTNPGAQYHTEGEAISYQIVANDGNGGTQALTYAIEGLPLGLAIDENTGLITGTLDANAADHSPYAITLTTTTNGKGNPSTTTAFNWNVTPVLVNSGSLDATVALQGRTDHTGTFSIKFYNPDDTTTVLYNFAADTNNSGALDTFQVEQGTYKITVNYPGYLQRVVTVTISELGQGLDYGELKGGDANSDNKVTISDLSLLIASYNKGEGDANYNTNADFNNDSKVTISDLSILISNYNTGGELIE